MPTVSKSIQPEVSTATLTPANAPIKQSAATIGTGTGAVHGGISSLFTGAAQWIKNIISYIKENILGWGGRVATLPAVVSVAQETNINRPSVTPSSEPRLKKANPAVDYDDRMNPFSNNYYDDRMNPFSNSYYDDTMNPFSNNYYDDRMNPFSDNYDDPMNPFSDNYKAER